MTKFSLTARWVLPIEGDPLEGAVVTIDDGVIVDVVDRSAAAGPVQDLGDVVLLPGLVNAHTHLEFSQLPQPLGTPGMSLPEWIRLVIGDRKRRDSTAGIAAGLRESLECGVTALGDIATSTQSDLPQPRPHLLAFQEVIGFSAGRLESVLTDARQRLDNSRDSTSRRSPSATGVSPHAPYTVHPQLLERLVEESLQRQLPVAMHLAESPEELELLADGVVVTPTSSEDPTLSSEWQEFSRTYDPASLASFVGQDLTIQLGVGRGADGSQSHFDSVSLSVVTNSVPEPSTFALAALGLLGLGWYGRRRRR